MRSITCTERYSEVTECEATAKETAHRYINAYTANDKQTRGLWDLIWKSSRWVINFKDKRSGNQLNLPVKNMRIVF